MSVRYDCSLHTLKNIMLFDLSWWCCARFGHFIILFYYCTASFVNAPTPRYGRLLTSVLNMFFLCAIMCTNLHIHVSRSNCVKSKSIRHFKLEMLPCNKSNFPTMYDIIYKQGQRSGRDNMAVAFKFYVIKDWSQFFFGSWRNNPNQVMHTVYPA